MLKRKALVGLCIFATQLLSIEVVAVKQRINYNEIINIENVVKANVSEVKKYCEPVRYEDLQNNKYIATHYLQEGLILCTKDVEFYTKNSVLFNFGAIQIERDGEIVYENDEYVKIKKRDGKIEKIYKDGRVE